MRGGKLLGQSFGGKKECVWYIRKISTEPMLVQCKVQGGQWLEMRLDVLGCEQVAEGFLCLSEECRLYALDRWKGAMVFKKEARRH